MGIKIKFIVWVILSMGTTFAAHGRESDHYAECSNTLHIGDHCWIGVKDVRPTQFAVGYFEIEDRSRELSKKTRHELRTYLEKRPAPVILGPNREPYIIDRHHLARALWNLDQQSAKIVIEVRYSGQGMSYSKFWAKMENDQFCYLFDENGRGPKPAQDLPTSVSDLANDPYRSLAGLVQDEGCYDKTSKPFAEFQWANFFRSRIAIGTSRQSFDAAIPRACRMSQDEDAQGLPGYRKRFSQAVPIRSRR